MPQASFKVGIMFAGSSMTQCMDESETDAFKADQRRSRLHALDRVFFTCAHHDWHPVFDVWDPHSNHDHMGAINLDAAKKKARPNRNVLYQALCIDILEYHMLGICRILVIAFFIRSSRSK